MLNQSISAKLSLGYAAVLIITILAATAITLSNRDIKIEVAAFVETTLPEIQELQRVTDGVRRIQIEAYSLYGTTTSVEQFDAAYEREKQAFTVSLASLKQLGPINSYQKLEETWKQLDQTVIKLRDGMAQERVDWDLAREYLGEMSEIAQLETSELAKLTAQLAAQAEISSETIFTEIDTAGNTIFLLVALMIAVAIVAYLYSSRQIAAPIGQFSTDLITVADNRDLSYQLPQHSQDEVGRASQSVNQLLRVIRDGMSGVSQAIGDISQSVTSLEGVSQSSDITIQGMNDEIGRIVHLMTELEAQIEEGAKRAVSASESANRGASAVNNGAGKVQETSRSIATLAVDIEHTADKLLSLRSVGDQVSSVVGTIAEIADQTSLLSLNAAIEAARAGESGRGFVVVADEVRKLSSRTHQSTVEVNAMLESIVSSITASVDTMTSNQEMAKSSVELAEQTAVTLSDISDSILGLSQECAEVAEVAGENLSGAKRVHQQIQAFEKVGTSVTTSSAQTRSAAKSLKDSAGSLQSLVNQFKLG